MSYAIRVDLPADRNWTWFSASSMIGDYRYTENPRNAMEFVDRAAAERMAMKIGARNLGLAKTKIVRHINYFSHPALR